jgi:hypothetical protein
MSSYKNKKVLLEVINEDGKTVHSENNKTIDINRLITKMPGIGQYFITKDSEAIASVNVGTCVWKYRLKLRGISPGAQPEGFYATDNDRVVWYSSPLQDFQIELYDLEPLGIDPIRVDIFKIKLGGLV